MKRLILTLATAACVAGSMAAATGASAQSRDHRGDQRYSQSYDQRSDQRSNQRSDQRRDQGSSRYDSRDYRGGYDRDGDRDNHRGWDRSRNNGYYLGSQFYYGPPPVAYYDRYDYSPAYSSWRAGSYLPSYYWAPDYVVYDYRGYGLRAPPRGYRWYDVNGDYVLAAIAGGLIAEALLH